MHNSSSSTNAQPITARAAHLRGGLGCLNRAKIQRLKSGLDRPLPPPQPRTTTHVAIQGTPQSVPPEHWMGSGLWQTRDAARLCDGGRRTRDPRGARCCWPGRRFLAFDIPYCAQQATQQTSSFQALYHAITQRAACARSQPRLRGEVDALSVPRQPTGGPEEANVSVYTSATRQPCSTLAGIPQLFLES